jgi:tRNA uridine 5-carboxymethylaminomethyl modification enzyme
MREFYDVIVIGGGHAGAEAAWAAASVLSNAAPTSPSDFAVALVTMDPSKIGTMSCNPAIGGLAKGQMVREIDALGGLMALAADATGIMFKMLNTSKGAAVRGPRAQCDKYAYAAEVQRLISTRAGIEVIAGTIDEVLIERGRIVGVKLPAGARVVCPDCDSIKWNTADRGKARPVFPAVSQPSAGQSRTIRTHAVVLTTGTFMRALMHTGEARTQGGRVGEGSAVGISGALRNLGFELGRLKTGTPPRLARGSIDWEGLDIQRGDDAPAPFSDMSMPEEDRSPRIDAASQAWRRFPAMPQIECRITMTTSASHELIRANMHRAPMYSGQIDAECGPRYCPSIEDKVMRFADRDSHHVFLEPESLHTNEIYCNGISTSLPIDVQEQLVRSMPGCRHAEILRWGYAVEYDMIWPHQIDSTCMTKLVPGLFTAGQINGTSGYEEAGGQGLVAGLNAARFSLACRSLASSHSSHELRGDPLDHVELIRLRRDQAYIGVMLDDLATKTPREPYRMFTSRAEHRLLLRADNADERLTGLGRELGLVDDVRWQLFQDRCEQLHRIREAFDRILVDGSTLREISRRQDVTLDDVLGRLDPSFHRALVDRVLTDAKYAGYIARQRNEIRRQIDAEHLRIPEWLDYLKVKSLRTEARAVLSRFQPATMGQASRLAGVNPADLTLIAVAIRRGPESIACSGLS